MRNLIFSSALACIAYAETAIDVPRLGYVPTRGGVRSVQGIPGATRLSAPLTRDLDLALTSPNGEFAVGISRATGEMTRVNLRDGSAAGLGLVGIERIVGSPTGERIVAVSGSRAYVLSKSGDRLAELDLPGGAILLAVADRGSALAVSVAEPEGAAIYTLDDAGSRRLLHASGFSAIAFLPESRDFVVADEQGLISRIGNDLALTPVATVAGVRALAGTRSGDRLIAAAGEAIYSVELKTGLTVSIKCQCQATSAAPLANSIFLITNPDAGPMWIVDASSKELRVAFIPEAVDE